MGSSSSPESYSFTAEEDIDKVPNACLIHKNSAISMPYEEEHSNSWKMKELELYIDKVKKIARPGCSQEVLDMALKTLSSLVYTLSTITSNPKPYSSL